MCPKIFSCICVKNNNYRLVVQTQVYIYWSPDGDDDDDDDDALSSLPLTPAVKNEYRINFNQNRIYIYSCFREITNVFRHC